MTSNQPSKLKIILHWVLATSVFLLFVSSWWMLSLPLPSENFKYRALPFQLHKNIGITLVAVITAMIVIRIVSKRKHEQPKRTKLEKLAELDHILTYILIFACCVSGYLSSSYSGWSTTLWWLIDLPVWSEENDELNILFSDLHMWTCWALLAVIALHIGAALYHAVNNDDVIKRMFRF